MQIQVGRMGPLFKEFARQQKSRHATEEAQSLINKVPKLKNFELF